MCDQERFAELISLKIDDMIRPEEEKELFSHLKSCADCRKLARELVELSYQLSQTVEEELPATFHSRVLEEIARSPQSQGTLSPLALLSKENMGQKWKPLLASAAAVAVIITAGALWGGNQDASDNQTLSIGERGAESDVLSADSQTPVASYAMPEEDALPMGSDPYAVQREGDADAQVSQSAESFPLAVAGEKEGMELLAQYIGWTNYSHTSDGTTIKGTDGRVITFTDTQTSESNELHFIYLVHYPLEEGGTAYAVRQNDGSIFSQIDPEFFQILAGNFESNQGE